MLHIVNKSHRQTSALASCLRLAQDGAALLLTEDAVYAATVDDAGIPEACRRLKVYALLPDLRARGVAERLIEGVTAVDYAGFVDLAAEHSSNQSWL